MGSLRPRTTFAALNSYPDEARLEIIRTDVAFHSTEEMEAFWQAVLAHVRALQVEGWGVLTDLRQAKGRNDPQFEQAMTRSRRPVYRLFARSAVVVGTSVGRMQVTRNTQDDPVETRVFEEMNAARAWLSRG